MAGNNQELAPTFANVAQIRITNGDKPATYFEGKDIQGLLQEGGIEESIPNPRQLAGPVGRLQVSVKYIR